MENMEHKNNNEDATIDDVISKSEQIHQYGAYFTNEKINNYESFEELGLSSETLKGIYAFGFEKPSKIQQKAIKPLIDGRNMIAQSQSGTGKTGTFVIGCIERIDKTLNCPQIIILSPTRELAKQTLEVCTAITRFHDSINIHLAIGGAARNSMSRRFSHLTKRNDDIINSNIIVGTPGRICDIIQKKQLNISNIKNIILDEGDEMLSIGFYEQITKIINFMKNTVSIQLFSATIPKEMIQLIDECNILKDPLKILVKQEEVSLKGIQQYYVVIEEQDKYPALKELYEIININQSIIYCNSRKKVEILTNNMLNDNFPVKCITGDMSQEDRNSILSEFRKGGLRVLITTDLLSRGLDVQQISLVLNYDMPKDIEVYIHRIGRGGRYGRKGVAINFSDFKNKISDKKILVEIEKEYSIRIEELPSDINTIFE
jgi:translation initiation factor 4A